MANAEGTKVCTHPVDLVVKQECPGGVDCPEARPTRHLACYCRACDRQWGAPVPGDQVEA